MNHDLIREICGRRSYQRGENYYKGHRVFAVELEQDATTWFIYSQVHGSLDYRQTITIDKRDEFFSGHCSCPVTINCKHVAATLFFVLEKNLLNKQESALDSVEQWLDGLIELGHAPVPVRQKTPSTYCLLYILQPDTDAGLALYVLPQKVRLLKNGGFGKAQSYSLDNISDTRQVQFLSPDDREIARLLVEQRYQGFWLLPLSTVRRPL
ncbi:MAG: hypothetical protein JKY14_13680 [Paraglaciecola sp.]|nr:hypothetical protein [Paraglaciecola sp.]